MAWRTPMVNTTHPQMAATGPATQAGNAGPIPAPVFAAYEPKDRTDPLYLHPSESPSLQLVTAQLEEEAYYPGIAEQIHEATSNPESSSESHQQGQGDINNQSSPPNQVGDSVTEPVNEPQPRRSTRVRTAPSYLSDYTCQSATMKRTSPHAISNVLSYSGLSQKYKAFAVNALTAKEPKTYNEAIKEDCWRKAMEDEISAL
nr:Retrovirus-related Pol polyprotein from transposon RE1 [Ipomoea batatas]